MPDRLDAPRLAHRIDTRLDAHFDRRAAWAVLWSASFLVLLPLYAPALRGAFLSDDFTFVVTSPWVRLPTLEHVIDILDPWGDSAETVANWAPVHLLLHAAQWKLFGPATTGYHVTNLALHALASTLLVAVFRRSGVPSLMAVLGGAFFLLHPANVEVAAWISEIKTLAAMVFALSALLCQERRPALGVLLFALGLLSKALAVFALPVAIVVVLCRKPQGAAARRAWAWIGVWVAVFALYAGPQWHAFERLGHVETPLHSDPLVAARTIVAFLARYLAMMVSGYGLSAFHDPPRAISWLDPWWLVGLAALVLFAARAVWTLARRKPEATYWAWALGGWIPISQIFPFIYPLGDRYLYMPMPGLIGAALLAGQAVWHARTPHFAQSARSGAPRRLLDAALLVSLAWILGLATLVPGRAAAWRSEPFLFLDAARHYPDGIQAHVLRAMRAAEQGDAELAAAELRRAREKGYDQFQALDLVSSYNAIRGEPAFLAAKADLAELWLARFSGRSDPNQAELLMAARGHLALGEREQALRALEDARAKGGPFQLDIEFQLEQLRREPAR